MKEGRRENGREGEEEEEEEKKKKRKLRKVWILVWICYGFV